MFEGRYFDGRTAAERHVRVTPDESGLRIVGDGVEAHWPRADIEVLERRGNFRLTTKAAPDTRLVLALTPEITSALRGMRVLGAGRAMGRGLVLVGALLGTSAALAALMFIGAPLAAEPLARATPREIEARMGVNLERQVHVLFRPCENTGEADASIAPLLARLETAAEPGFDIRLTFVRSQTPNAMALPGGRVMVTSALLETLENPDELAAVLAHELGHVHARDGMISLYRHAGLGIFLETITGGTGIAQQIILLSGQLAELRYTRAQEERADDAALRTMARAGYNPEALARAFERIRASITEAHGDGEQLDIDTPEWLLSHPDLGARIAAARAAAAPARDGALSAESWDQVRAACAAPGKS